MHSKIITLEVKKIILILVFGFILFGGNVFAQTLQNDSEGKEVQVGDEIKYVKNDGNSGLGKADNSEARNKAITEENALKNGNTSSTETNNNTNNNSSSSSASSNGIEVHVSEDIPGAGCVGSPGDYTCTVEPGFKTVMQLMGGIIKYFTYLAALGGVLFIVINGIMLSMGSMGGNKDEIKKKITMTIGGLILLLLSGLILNAIAPWIYK